MQLTIVSKSQFKAKALEFFRIVQSTGKPILVTHDDKPVIKISLYNKSEDINFKTLFGTLVKYDSPFESVGLGDWEVLK